MNYICGGGKLLQRRIPAQWQTATAHAVYIVPALLSCVTAFVALGTVRMFRGLPRELLASDTADFETDVDNAIGILLGLLLTVEVGTRLVIVSDARRKLPMYCSLLSDKTRQFFVGESTRTDGQRMH